MQPCTMARSLGVSGQRTLTELPFTNDISTPCRPKITTWSSVCDWFAMRYCAPGTQYILNQVASNWHACIAPQERQSCKPCSLTTVKCMNVLANLRKHMKPSLLRMSRECAWPIWSVQHSWCSSWILPLMRHVCMTRTSLMWCSLCWRNF